MLSDVTLATVDVSDLILLITTQDIPSIKNCRLFLDLLLNLGIKRDRVVFIMNRFDKKVNITPDRVADNLKQEVSYVLPIDDTTAVKAVNRGVPFVLDNKSQPIARGIFALADIIRSKVSEQDENKG
jgi:pilus assembly protein CpaE